MNLLEKIKCLEAEKIYVIELDETLTSDLGYISNLFAVLQDMGITCVFIPGLIILRIGVVKELKNRIGEEDNE